MSRDIEISEQTFGRDLYTILRDSFLVKCSPMGNYADVYIHLLLNDIYMYYKEISENINLGKRLPTNEDVQSKLNEFEKRAMVIGNVIIRKKIKLMLNDVKGLQAYVLDKGKGRF